MGDSAGGVSGDGDAARQDASSTVGESIGESEKGGVGPEEGGEQAAGL